MTLSPVFRYSQPLGIAHHQAAGVPVIIDSRVRVMGLPVLATGLAESRRLPPEMPG